MSRDVVFPVDHDHLFECDYYFAVLVETNYPDLNDNGIGIGLNW